MTQAEAPGHRQAADLAVQRLERDGGFERSAIVVVLPTEPARPAVYLYGESPGAPAGQSALTEAGPQTRELVCGTVWAGVPGNQGVGFPGERMLANPDAPVTYLSGGTATRQPVGWPLPVWVPRMSLGTAVLDLPGSLSTGEGHGHRYGPEQDWALPRCG